MGDGVAREIVSRYLARTRQKEAAELALQPFPASASATPQHSHDGAGNGHSTSDVDKSRWGTRDVEIISVRLLDGTGQDTHMLESGAPLTIEISYRVRLPVPDPVFGIGIYRDDGVWCYGTNTHIEQVPLDDLGEAGVVRIVFDRLELLEGTYTLDVAVHTPGGHPYDYHRPYCTFKVRSEVKDSGVFRPVHRWLIQPRTSPAHQWLPITEKDR